mgnify:CR=1 FL=1
MYGSFLPAKGNFTSGACLKRIGAKSGVEWREAGRYNKLLPPEYVHDLSLDYVVLPEAMKESGYNTFF